MKTKFLLKKVEPGRLPFLLALIIMFISYVTVAQVPDFNIPSMLEDPRAAEREDATLKSTKAIEGYSYLTNYNGSYYSDYYCYFQWVSYTFGCDCSSKSFKVLVRLASGDQWPGTKGGTSYTGYDLKVKIGPNQSGSYNYWVYEQGTDDYFIFGCISSCSRYYYSANSKTYYTAAIRPPTSPVATQNTWDYRIDLSWGKTTDIPDAEHGYLIKRDGVEIAKVFNGQRTYSDKTLGPNETHTYTIHTIWPDNTSYTQISSGVSVVGKTFDLNLNASVNQPDVIDLTWNSLESIEGKGGASLTKYKIDRYDEENNKLTTLPADITSTNNYPDESSTLIPGYAYKYTLRPYPEAAFYSDTAWGKKLPNGSIKGKVLSPTGKPVMNIKVCAIRQDTVPQDTTRLYYAYTDTAGTFEIRNIYYYLESKFRLIPVKENHEFEPAYEEPTLSKLIPAIGGIVFTDISAFTVNGRVVQQGNRGLCPVEDVGIYVDDAANPETFTDIDGNYAISVGQINNYTIKPVLENHGFDPESVEYYVYSDTTFATIFDTTTFTLSGVVKASCDTYIGKAKIGITSGEAGAYCYDTIITTDTLTGMYKIKLPARKYEISILDFYSENIDVENTDVLVYFPTTDVDLTFGDINQDFIYRSTPDLKVSGFLDYGCGAYDNIPILEQGYQYTIKFEVREVFGESNCLADTGFIIVQNRVGDETNQVDTVYLEGGMAEYSFIPGYPNLIAPHLKNLTLTAQVGSESVTESIDIMVEGNFPREQTFSTVSPEIPFMILRDPPGDASYSYLEESTTTETAMRLSAQLSGSLNAWAEVKAGVKFEAGFGVTVETEIWGKVRGSLEVGTSISQQDEFTLSITNGERFSTSGNADITGEKGDVFAGSALNIIYALTDVIKYNPNDCNVSKTVSLSMGVDGFATTFIYTEGHIRNTLIPQLAYLRDYYEARDNDSAQIYVDQIDVWQQTLKLNQDLKDKASFIENRSFSAGTPYEAYQEVATSKSTAIEFSLYIEAGVAIEAGLDIGGVGVSGGVEVKLRTEFGLGSTLTEMKSKRTGFVLDDDDEGDFFTLDICADEVYGTPVFNIVAGVTSCPWEPGTQPREGVQIISDPYVVNVDDPNGTAVFHLQLGNTSQSDEDRIYNLIFEQGSNPDGALITLGGSQVQGGIATPYYISAGGSKEATVTVRRGPEAFDYDNLQFSLLSQCFDPEIADTLYLDVHFSNPCSQIALSKPLANWILSSMDNDRIKVRVRGYNRDLLDFVKVQISKSGEAIWQTVLFLDKTDLDPEYTDINMLLEQYRDGKYDIRALAECSAGKVYSEISTGTIDRRPPLLFGLPEPADLVLDSSDMIMAIFDEDVNCYNFSASQVSLTDLTKDIAVDVAVGCSGNTVLIIPDLSGIDYEGDQFLVEIDGIEDMHGNASTETISWSFEILASPIPSDDSDTDKDGVLNKVDNCPWSANEAQSDLDSDGKGDACDDDIDGDGVPNQTDNCIMTKNADQEDINEDGIGDACQDLTPVIQPQAIEGFHFYKNYPNPFTEETTLSYVIPVESHILIKVVDVIGNQIDILENRNVSPGTWEVIWDARNFSSGVYFCTIYVETRGERQMEMKTIKMVKSN
ncbi:MAG: thrombospondin type 3 repeat-containing protein [Bacteroidales bacterium]|nr:thrombospondin type 3 repeat-containing protein [Bacteroidales bacterium]